MDQVGRWSGVFVVGTEARRARPRRQPRISKDENKSSVVHASVIYNNHQARRGVTQDFLTMLGLWVAPQPQGSPLRECGARMACSSTGGPERARTGGQALCDRPTSAVTLPKRCAPPRNLYQLLPRLGPVSNWNRGLRDRDVSGERGSDARADLGKAKGTW